MRLPWTAKSIEGGPSIETSITEREAKILSVLAGNGTGLVLEVGSAFGFSAITMVKGGARHVFAIDPHGGQLHGAPAIVDSLSKMRENLRAYDVEAQVSVILSPSQVALPKLYDLGARFDFIFIDGDHARDTVLNDLRWGAELGTGHRSEIAVHDWGEETCPDVRPACQEVFGDPLDLVDTLAVW